MVTSGSPSLSQAVKDVQERIAGAAERGGRAADAVEIVAVTKSFAPERVVEAWGLGLWQFGESRVQEAALKRAALPINPDRTPRWHLVGHLQTNKARKAVEIFDCIQSVDSLRLAAVLDKEGERRAQPVSCLIEIKISDEPAKQGLSPDLLAGFLKEASRFSFLRIEGLMGVAPLVDDPEKARPAFRLLRGLFDRNRADFLVDDPILSMGMSDDFEVAVEEGSTMVRLGRALFGARPAPRGPA